MGKTFQDTDQYKIIEPVFSRSRQSFRGSRSSAVENLEINAILVDLHRLESNVSLIENTIESVQSDLVSNLNTLTEQEVLEDGANFEIEDVQVSFLSNPEQSMILETLNKISSKIQRTKNKIQRLEVNT